MKLENQVVSIELAQKLKDLGVKQDSLFYWLDYGGEKWNVVADSSFKVCDNSSPAFTVAELGEMLAKVEFYSGYDMTNGFICWNKNKPRHQKSETEADARAKMLIYLLENKLITLND